MTYQQEDEEREYRISMQIIVDSYGPKEQAIGRYYYLDGKMQFPFTSPCIEARLTRKLIGLLHTLI
jgi:Calcium binding